MHPTTPIQDSRYINAFWIIGGAITAFRVLTLALSSADLGPDEAQYWVWAQDPAFGYFSKPPMIAWAIAATTSMFGDGEWAVRLSAPFFHFGTAAFLFFTARILYNARIAFWTGVAWLTLPGVILSAFLITTDAPLLFFWCGGIYFLFRITTSETAASTDYLALGIMIGLGLMSKYAMIYFPAAIALSALVDEECRKKLFQPYALASAALALAIFAPNIWWNTQHDFQTLSHTAANAKWSANLFQFGSLLTFLGAQFFIAGIVAVAGLLYLSMRPALLPGEPGKVNTNRILLIFALTPIVIIAGQAFISRAHANWAAAAYPTAILLTTGFFFRVHLGWLVKASAAIHLAAVVLFSIGVMNFALTDRIGLTNATKSIRGWEEQSAEIMAMATGFDAVVIDDRSLMGAMLYYQKDAPVDVVAIDPNANTDNHYEAFFAFDPERHKHVLFVTTRDDDAHVNYRFKTIKPLGKETVTLGTDFERTYHLFDIADYYSRKTSARRSPRR